MTTSTNKTVIEGSMKGGVAKATSVTLAGVLAVGMVPLPLSLLMLLRTIRLRL